MSFVVGTNRYQLETSRMEDDVKPDSIVRCIDAFVDSLDLEELGFDRSVSARMGRPGYDAGSLLKLYIYGLLNGLRSSRRLAWACRNLIEARWLVCGRTPDFRTIADFRKRNAECLKGVFEAFDDRIFADQKAGLVSLDGTKIEACCANSKVYTKERVEEQIPKYEQRIQKMMDEMGERDRIESEEEQKRREAQLQACMEDKREMNESLQQSEAARRELQKRLEKAEKKLKELESCRDVMEKSGTAQISVTDPDCRVMKTHGDFEPAYNVQTAVEAETRLMRNYDVTNHCTDHGLIQSVTEPIREKAGDNAVLDVTADKGYESSKDLAACLESGIVPHVIPTRNKDHYELETVYEETELTAEMLSSTDPEDIKRVLRAGKIPEVYKDVITGISVETTYRGSDKSSAAMIENSPDLTEEEAKDQAEKGFFVRLPERNVVICPGGRTLQQKSVRKNGKISYAQRSACKNCPHHKDCTSASYKTVDFTKDELEKINRR